MPRGGLRETSYKPTWKLGKTTVIRVPEALAPKLLDIARELDSGQSLPCNKANNSQMEQAISLLNEGLLLKPNAGGAIKNKIRLALQLLRASM